MRGSSRNTSWYAFTKLGVLQPTMLLGIEKVEAKNMEYNNAKFGLVKLLWYDYLLKYVKTKSITERGYLFSFIKI